MIIEKAKEMLEYRDGNLYWKTRPSKSIHVGDKAGTPHSRGYIHITILRKKILAHRLIFAMHHGFFPDEVDHINGDKKDNRIENLREATSSQNKMNVGARTNSKSGSKCVYWSEKFQKWKVQVRAGGKIRHFGYYKSIEDAKAAAKEAINQLHGEFANHD